MMWIESTRSADERLATRNNSKANTDLQSYNSLPDADPRKKIIAQQYPNSIMWNAEDITEEGKGVDPKALL
jgi:hypothetical protein